MANTAGTETGTATQKAAKVRADVKAALKAGAFGQLPEGLKISVRTEYASLMSAINVTIKGAADEWAATPACEALGRDLLEIVARHYEWDGRHRFADVSLDDGTRVA